MQSSVLYLAQFCPWDVLQTECREVQLLGGSLSSTLPLDQLRRDVSPRGSLGTLICPKQLRLDESAKTPNKNTASCDQAAQLHEVIGDSLRFGSHDSYWLHTAASPHFPFSPFNRILAGIHWKPSQLLLRCHGEILDFESPRAIRKFTQCVTLVSKKKEIKGHPCIQALFFFGFLKLSPL